MNKSLKVSQKEFELEISRILDHGDIETIVPKSGNKYSYIEGQLNANCERKSYLYGALEIVCAFDEELPDKGERIWQTMIKYRELSKQPLELKLCAKSETGKLAKEVADCVDAALNGLTFGEQMTELLQVAAQLEKTKEALINNFNNVKTTNGRVASVKLNGF